MRKFTKGDRPLAAKDTRRDATKPLHPGLKPARVREARGLDRRRADATKGRAGAGHVAKMEIEGNGLEQCKVMAALSKSSPLSR